jgi:hypothetical protein
MLPNSKRYSILGSVLALAVILAGGLLLDQGVNSLWLIAPLVVVVLIYGP